MSCGKIVYGSASEAREKGRKIVTRKHGRKAKTAMGARNWKLRPYWCQPCGGYHLYREGD